MRKKFAHQKIAPLSRLKKILAHNFFFWRYLSHVRCLTLLSHFSCFLSHFFCLTFLDLCIMSHYQLSNVSCIFNSCLSSPVSLLLPPVSCLLPPVSCLLSPASYLLSLVSFLLSPVSGFLSLVSSLLSHVLFHVFCLAVALKMVQVPKSVCKTPKSGSETLMQILLFVP